VAKKCASRSVMTLAAASPRSRRAIWEKRTSGSQAALYTVLFSGCDRNMSNLVGLCEQREAKGGLGAYFMLSMKFVLCVRLALVLSSCLSGDATYG